ncbi:hypothetical protein [Bacillus sp. XF8]|uniref:hypothetical protein n=1 Tax=Bacillus sp. XF8 TaxID=2819289 RepID=UPI001AA09ABC|nr:hypothetical protein [Bacillus sp. XF8]MBO1583033.1 hypothetical protein [Bacillus sp. XF8]
MKAQDIKEDKSLWEKMHVEGVGRVLLVEESYYDGIIELVDKLTEALEKGANIKTYNDLVDNCQGILERGWKPEAVYRFMEIHSGWGPDSIDSAIDEAYKRAASKS